MSVYPMAGAESNTGVGAVFGADAASRTSALITLPCGPVPYNPLKSTP